MIFIRYDHSQRPGSRDKYIGPFDSEVEAEGFYTRFFSPKTPIAIDILGCFPVLGLTLSPQEAVSYLKQKV